MSVLVSFCLFGDDSDDIYRGGLIKNLLAYRRWQPTWVCRVYASVNTPEDFLTELRSHLNADVRLIPGKEDQTATLWRLQALTEGDYETYLFRDADSRPIARERAAVEAFLASNRNFHIMRDHPRHGMPILAGLWGVRGRIVPRVAKTIRKMPSDDYYLVDQDFLRRYVWPIARGSLIQHVGCEFTFKTAHLPFPVPRSSEGFVGEGFFANNSPRYPSHRLELRDPQIFLNQRTRHV